MSPKPKTDKKPFWQEILLILLRNYGVPGFLIGIVVIILLTFPSASQKHEFFDIYILFKDKNGFIIGMAALFVLFGAAFAIQNRYYRKSIKLRDEEIDRISAEKSDLQRKLTGKELHKTLKK